MGIDFGKILQRQREWSLHTFGPGERTEAVLDHIEKEIEEIRAAPRDIDEWVGIAMIAFDGAMRAGHSAAEILAHAERKLAINEGRKWPDWRTAPAGKAIEHVRGESGNS